MIDDIHEHTSRTEGKIREQTRRVREVHAKDSCKCSCGNIILQYSLIDSLTPETTPVIHAASNVLCVSTQPSFQGSFDIHPIRRVHCTCTVHYPCVLFPHSPVVCYNHPRHYHHCSGGCSIRIKRTSVFIMFVCDQESLCCFVDHYLY